MLSGKELLKMVSQYVDYVYWPLNSAIDKNSKLVSTKDLIDNEEALSQLEIKYGTQITYDKLKNYYQTRAAIISYLSSIVYFADENAPCELSRLFLDEKTSQNYENIFKNYQLNCLMSILTYVNNDKKINKNKSDRVFQCVYSDYLNRSLIELINMNCKYVEVSYSNYRTISLLKIDSQLQEKIKCKFLLSTERDRRVRQMKYCVNELKEGLKKGFIVGVDIMGKELPLTDNEKKYAKNSYSRSFKRKLEMLVDVLKDDSNGVNTLRIHSGESKISLGNTEWILETLLEIKEKHNLSNPLHEILPPPEIRIGHGVYFDKENTKYVEMLKKLGVIVEINASSNFALKNIDSHNALPYDFYLKNGISIVLSTDGHGLYDTSLTKESDIARQNSGNYEEIFKFEEVLLGGKMKR